MLRRLVLLTALCWVLLSPATATAETALVAVAANFAAAAKALARDYQAASGNTVELTTGLDRQALRPDQRGRAPSTRCSRRTRPHARAPGAGRARDAGALCRGDPRPLGALGRGGRRPARGACGRHGSPRRRRQPRPCALRPGRRRRDLGHGPWVDALAPPHRDGRERGPAPTLSLRARASGGGIRLAGLGGGRGDRSRPRLEGAAGALYPPIRQDAILLRRGAGNAAAEGFLAYLATPEGQRGHRGPRATACLDEARVTGAEGADGAGAPMALAKACGRHHRDPPGPRHPRSRSGWRADPRARKAAGRGADGAPPSSCLPTGAGVLPPDPVQPPLGAGRRPSPPR